MFIWKDKIAEIILDKLFLIFLSFLPPIQKYHIIELVMAPCRSKI